MSENLFLALTINHEQKFIKSNNCMNSSVEQLVEQVKKIFVKIVPTDCKSNFA